MSYTLLSPNLSVFEVTLLDISKEFYRLKYLFWDEEILVGMCAYMHCSCGN